jgi:hypothetical protein
MDYLKQFFGLVLVAAIGYGLYFVAIKAGGGPQDLTVAPDNTATFTGTVTANDTSCFDKNSGRCFLLVKTEKTQVFVLYNTGDTSFCVNEKAATAGRNMKVGNNVRVYGFYKQEKNTHTVLTCPDTGYYIKPF